jgi:ABC-type multidrug transport system permease subunit
MIKSLNMKPHMGSLVFEILPGVVFFFFCELVLLLLAGRRFKSRSKEMYCLLRRLPK